MIVTCAQAEVYLASPFPIPSAGFQKIEVGTTDSCFIKHGQIISGPEVVWQILQKGTGQVNLPSKTAQGLFDYWLCFSIVNTSQHAQKLYCDLPYLAQNWELTLNEKTHFRAFDPQLEGLWIRANASGFRTDLKAGQQKTFLLRCASPAIEKRLVPTIWELGAYNQYSSKAAVYYSLAKSIIVGAFFVIFCFGFLLSCYYLRTSDHWSIYAYYTIFQLCLLGYFVRDFAWHSPIAGLKISDADWYGCKVFLALGTYVFYIKFLERFLSFYSAKPWLNTFSNISISCLIVYGLTEWILQKIGLEEFAIQIFYYLRVLLFIPGLWLLWKTWSLPDQNVRYLRWAMVATIISMLITLVLVLSLKYHFTWFGLDKTLLPLYIGLLVESSIFLLAVANQENAWIQQKTKALEDTSKIHQKLLEENNKQVEESQRNLADYKIKIEKKDKLLREQLHQKIVQEKAAEIAKRENEILRARFAPEVLLLIQEQILANLETGDHQHANEKLRAFAILMRDSLYFLRQEAAPLIEELKLCEHLGTLLELPIPSLVLAPEWQNLKVPPLFLLNIMHHALSGGSNKFHLEMSSFQEGCRIECISENFDTALLKHYQERLQHFNKIFSLQHSMQIAAHEKLVIEFHHLVIDEKA